VVVPVDHQHLLTGAVDRVKITAAATNPKHTNADKRKDIPVALINFCPIIINMAANLIPAGPILAAGVQYKAPPANVVPVDENGFVEGQMYHLWSANPNDRGHYHGMVVTFWRVFLNFYIFDYNGILSNQDILVNKDWRPHDFGPAERVYIRIRHDRLGEYLFYPINAADIDNGNNAMEQNGGRRRRARRSRRSRRSRRRRTSKNNRR